MSVVLPVYNGERFFAESTTSILEQTLRDFELIVLDDGSTDDSYDLATELAATDRRVRLHRNATNRGLIDTLNIGFAMARGRYLARQDVDDIAFPERLEKQVAFLDSHPQVGLLGSAYVRIGRSGQKSRRTPPLDDTHIRWRMLFGNVWCHTSMMIRRSLFANGEDYYRRFLHAEDYELWLRLLEKTQGATLPQPLVYLRMHDDSVSAKHPEEQTTVVDQIAGEQIAGLLPQVQLDRQDLARLRRAVRAREIDPTELALIPLVADLFAAFARRPEVDRGSVERLHESWTVRVLAASSIRLWPRLLRSGLLQPGLRRRRVGFWLLLLGRLPWLKLRRLVRRP